MEWTVSECILVGGLEGVCTMCTKKPSKGTWRAGTHAQDCNQLKETPAAHKEHPSNASASLKDIKSPLHFFVSVDVCAIVGSKGGVEVISPHILQ